MRIALTGTPGVGKTTVAGLAAEAGWRLVDVKAWALAEGCVVGHDEADGADVIDVAKLARKVAKMPTGGEGSVRAASGGTAGKGTAGKGAAGKGAAGKGAAGKGAAGKGAAGKRTASTGAASKGAAATAPTGPGLGDATIYEGHLSHLLPVDVAWVLRCDPDVLRRRLQSRGYKAAKVRENCEAEALDLILQEALDRVPRVVQRDATARKPAELLASLLEATRKASKGHDLEDVDWSGRLPVG